VDAREVSFAIRNCVGVKEIAARYGYYPNRLGFICCPFHAEKTASLHLSNDRWHCFGCNEGGDVISFVMKQNDMSFWGACKFIDSEFHLGLFDGANKNEAQRLISAKIQESETREKLIKLLEERYWDAFDKWRKYDSILSDFAPANMDEITEEQADALRNIAQANYYVKEAETSLYCALNIGGLGDL
jgi:hypothetical protein